MLETSGLCPYGYLIIFYHKSPRWRFKMLISRYVSYAWLVSNYLRTYLIKMANNSHLTVSVGHKFLRGLAQVLSWDCSRCWLGLASPKWLEDSLSDSALTWLLAGSLSFSPHGLLHSDLLTWQLMFPGWMIEDRDERPDLASHNCHFCHTVSVRRESPSAACTHGN